MSNQFSKEERVAFEAMLEGFQDALVLSRNCAKYQTDQRMMERANDVIWRPQPYIATSFDGTDQTANFGDVVQLSVPATIGFNKSVPWIMTAEELRDALQEDRLGAAARQRLASDINVAIMNVAAYQGSLVVPITTAAGTYNDIAACDSIMNEQGVMTSDRYCALNSRDYNGMAGNLAVATRSFGNEKSEKAYERGYVGPVSGFETYKLDYGVRLAAAAGGAGLTISTVDGANDYTPVATRVATTGERSNVDNRFQTVTLNSTVGVVAGDCFTIATLEAVHHITKQSTGQLKTFRVISVDSGTTMTICPPIITNQVASDASAAYQNCTIGTKAANSAIVFLNIVACQVNAFWHRDALEIIPGRYAMPTDAGASIMRATTDNGIELVLQKQYDINTMKTKYRADVKFGVVNKQPEMSGILLFAQV